MPLCRLYTGNDYGAAIEHLAEKTWDSRMAYSEGRTPCNKAGGTWQSPFREMAVAARQALNER